MVERTREEYIEVKFYRDTNKMTYEDSERFDTIDEAIKWLESKK